jgi:hypothetical protein
MKQIMYELPKFIGVIFRKVQVSLEAAGINMTRFHQYCLAVQLCVLKEYQGKIEGLSLSEQDNINLQRLCVANGFTHNQEENTVTGLCSDPGNERMNKVQLLVYYFCHYEALKDADDMSPTIERMYEYACRNLEELRAEFRLPGRFKYNKFKRRENPFFKGSIEVGVPDVPTLSDAAGVGSTEL